MAGDVSGSIKTLYEEVCKRHDGIAEFRGKLLTLLPIASGAGILLVAKDPIAPTSLPHLLPIGSFAALVTLGLFFHELRGIQECNALINAAKKLEKGLLHELGHFGAFHVRPHPVLHGTVGTTGAALMIYPAVVGAWVYVAAVGAAKSPGATPLIAVIAIAAGFGTLLLGLVVVQQQRKLLDALEKRASLESKAVL